MLYIFSYFIIYIYFLYITIYILYRFVYYIFLYSLWKETTHKFSNVAATVNLLSSVYVIATTCFNECFLFCVITGRYYFLWKFIVTLRVFPTSVFLRSLTEVFWKRYNNISTITTQCSEQSSKIKSH